MVVGRPGVGRGDDASNNTATAGGQSQPELEQEQGAFLVPPSWRWS